MNDRDPAGRLALGLVAIEQLDDYNGINVEIEETEEAEEKEET